MRKNRNIKSKSEASDSKRDFYKSKNSKDVADKSKTNVPDDLKGFNDLSWYVVDEQVLNDAARIPYSIPVGMPYGRDGSFMPISGVQLQGYDDAMPGILVSHIMPTLGNAHNASDPVNVAANSIYQFVRSRISGSRTYDAVDFMIYLGAMDSCFTYCTFLTRLYGTVFTYHQSNRYLSRALVESQGIDYDNLVANLSAFRAGFNVRIAKIRSLYVPSNMPIFVRHAWMFSKYYIEGESEKDQIYLHMPEGYYLFDKDSSGAGMLHAKAFDLSNPLTVNDMLTILDNMLDPIYADEDFNKISGDLLKAYEGQVFTITEIPDIATVRLEFNEEVLLQFKNAKYLDVVRDTDATEFVSDAFDYVQNSTKEYLVFNMTSYAIETIRSLNGTLNVMTHVGSGSQPGEIKMLSSKFYNWSKPYLLTTPHRDVVPGENMINTRLTLALDIVADNSSFYACKVQDIAMGTEWPVRFAIYTFHRNKSTGALTLFHRNYNYAMFLDTTYPLDIQQEFASQNPILSTFKYHPEIFVDFAGSVNGSLTYINSGRSNFDVDNYALVDFNAIKGLHTAAILGQYKVPTLSVGR